MLIYDGTRAGGDNHVEVALRSASGATSPLRGFVPRSLRQRGPRDVWRPVEVGLALVNRRRRAVGPNPSVWRIPDLRSLPCWERGSGVYPRCPSSGGILGSVWLVEGAGYGRSYTVALSDGGILRNHKTATNGPRSRRCVGRHNQLVASSTPLGSLQQPMSFSSPSAGEPTLGRLRAARRPAKC